MHRLARPTLSSLLLVGCAGGGPEIPLDAGPSLESPVGDASDAAPVTAPCPAATDPMRTVAVDFGVHTDPPLVKKYGVMNSGVVPMDRSRRDFPKLSLLRADSMRIDLSIGKGDAWAARLIDGTPNDLRYDFTLIDELSRLTSRQGVLPYWSFSYMPLPLQTDGWRSPPRDLARWGEAARSFARHFRDAGIPIGAYEIYNEPDYDDFFTGTRDQYLAMYRAAARGMREGDPDAVVGGPALAYDLGWTGPLL